MRFRTGADVALIRFQFKLFVAVLAEVHRKVDVIQGQTAFEFRQSPLREVVNLLVLDAAGCKQERYERDRAN